jgi:hypothetical protein
MLEMRKFSEVKEFESEILMLVKFTKEEYIQSLLDGNLYMNNIKYFIDLENQTKVRGQGDKLEASNVINDVHLKFYKEGTDELLAEATSSRLVERNHFFDNIPIFCITSFDSKDFQIVEETEYSYKVKFAINEKEMKHMKESFGEKAIFINPAVFLNRVENNFTEKGFEFDARKVNYENLDINDSKRLEHFNGTSIIPLFIKDIFFESQREFRIAIFNNPTESVLVPNIGDLSDISYVMDTEDLFNYTMLEVKKRN